LEDLSAGLSHRGMFSPGDNQWELKILALRH